MTWKPTNEMWKAIYDKLDELPNADNMAEKVGAVLDLVITAVQPLIAAQATAPLKAQLKAQLEAFVDETLRLRGELEASMAEIAQLRLDLAEAMAKAVAETLEALARRAEISGVIGPKIIRSLIPKPPEGT